APDIIFVDGCLPVDERGEVQHPGDVEAQTRLVMSAVERELRWHDAALADLVRVNVHYVGRPTPEDLHRNLDVRSQLYVPPGPASTGVPVPRLQLPAPRCDDPHRGGRHQRLTSPLACAFNAMHLAHNSALLNITGSYSSRHGLLRRFRDSVANRLRRTKHYRR